MIWDLWSMKKLVSQNVSLSRARRDSKDKVLIIFVSSIFIAPQKNLDKWTFFTLLASKKCFCVFMCVCVCVCVQVCAFKCVCERASERKRAREREREKESERERERHLHNRCMLFETGHPDWLKSSTWLASAKEIDSFNSKMGSFFSKRSSQNLTLYKKDLWGSYVVALIVLL